MPGGHRFLDVLQPAAAGVYAATQQHHRRYRRRQGDQQRRPGQVSEQSQHAAQRTEDAAELRAGGDGAGAGATQMHRIDLRRVRNQHGDHAAGANQQGDGGNQHRQLRMHTQQAHEEKSQQRGAGRDIVVADHR